MPLILLILGILFSTNFYGDEYTIDLKDPSFNQGKIFTHQGGVIKGNELRIQATEIEYSRSSDSSEQKVTAIGNLLFQYRQFFFSGKQLEYELTSRTGTIIEGTVSVGGWFIGGDTISISPDGSCLISNGYITTSEERSPSWKLVSKKVHLSSEAIISAQQIKMELFDFPIFWFPKFATTIHNNSSINYKLIWDDILKEKIMIEWKLYDSKNFSITTRLDYRFTIGPGLLLSTRYSSSDKTTLFNSNNYAAFDKIVPDEIKNRRFRLQGMFSSLFNEGATQLNLTYDRMSDDKMAQNFKSDRFEINSQERTIAQLSHRSSHYDFLGKIQPCINPFQSLNQQLPSISWNITPFPLGTSRFFLDNRISLEYLDYSFAPMIRNYINSFQSIRSEADSTIYRSFKLSSWSITPSLGITGIGYGNSPLRRPLGELLLRYQLDFTNGFYRSYSHFQHQIQPYLKYIGSTTPNLSNQNIYIFSTNDGLSRQNMIRLGAYNLLYFSPLLSSLAIDFYANLFLGTTPFHSVIPKIYFVSQWNNPSCYLKAEIIYNIQNKLWDRTNFKLDWTISSQSACSIEMRHRSEYDWRKADRSNYMLDLSQPVDQLIASPLSDRRNTLLAGFYTHLSPLSSFQIKGHYGWGRSREPSYIGYEIFFSTLLASKWKLEIGYSYSPMLKEWILPSIKLVSKQF